MLFSPAPDAVYLCLQYSETGTWLTMWSKDGKEAVWPPTSHSVPVLVSMTLTHFSLTVLKTIAWTLLFI